MKLIQLKEARYKTDDVTDEFHILSSPLYKYLISNNIKFDYDKDAGYWGIALVKLDSRIRERVGGKLLNVGTSSSFTGDVDVEWGKSEYESLKVGGAVLVYNNKLFDNPVILDIVKSYGSTEWTH